MSRIVTGIASSARTRSCATKPDAPGQPGLAFDLALDSLQRSARHQEDQADQQGQDPGRTMSCQNRSIVSPGERPGMERDVDVIVPVLVGGDHAPHFRGLPMDLGALGAHDRAADAADVALHHRLRAETDAAAHRRSRCRRPGH